MQVTETKSEGLRREYAVVIGAAEIDAKVVDKLQGNREAFAMKGFRKGKAPLAVMRKMFGKSLLGETVQELVDGAVKDLVARHEMRPAMQPDVRITTANFQEGDDLKLEVAMELLPEIPEVDYAAVELERLVVEAPESEVDEALNKIAESSATYAPREEGALSETKDQLSIDFLGKIDGEAFEGGKAEDFPLVLGSGQFIPGFEDQLLGRKAGEEVAVKVTFPENYGAQNLAGKEAVFDVVVKEVRAPGKAELNDDLAKKFGAADLAELRSRVAERVKAEYDAASRAHVKRRLLDALDEKVSFDLPPTMVRVEADSIAHQLWHEEHPEEHGHNHGSIEPTDEHKKIAERRVRLGLLLAQVGTVNQIAVSEQELNQAIFQQARQYPGQEREFFQWVRGNQNALNQVQAPIFEDKVVDFILGKAKIADKTVSKEELEKALAELEEAEL
ncbi:trigger factor [Neomegalonema sp.]|uniref:trigger factor n=1 Tax=Neomegalonema sp. TaxID=2039713 RepID=UPI002603DF17|nr:trigger factor [Neomegalonema sp.]MDD2867901.1 trigger factor [Neomegalonema sp.]